MQIKGKRRFFFHYRKQTNTMTIHWKKECLQAKEIKCSVPVETKWNKIQPRLVIQGFASEVIIENDIAYIN
jgi:hypothetical protein